MIVAPKANNKGIIPISKEIFTLSSQRLDTGRKSLNKSNRSNTAVATDAPSGIPGTVVNERAPEEAEPDEIKLISVVRTP